MNKMTMVLPILLSMASGNAWACGSMSEEDKDAQVQAKVSAAYNQLMGKEIVGKLSKLTNSIYMLRLKDGTVVAVPNDRKFIIIDPLIVSTETGEHIPNDTVLGPYQPVSRNASVHQVVSKKLVSFSDNPLYGQVVGKGEKRITVFVDPVCPSCKRFLKALRYAKVPSNISFFIVPANIISKKEANQKADELLSSKGTDYSEQILFQKIPESATKEGIEKQNTNLTAFSKTKAKFVPAFVVDGKVLKDNSLGGTAADKVQELIKMATNAG